MDIAQTDLADVLADFGSIRLGEAFEEGECGEADFALCATSSAAWCASSE